MLPRYKLKRKKRFKLKKKIPEHIINLVALLGKGKRNAISAKYIQSAFEYDDNEVTNKKARELVKEAVMDYGFPIGSNTKGYFLIENVEELNESTKLLEAHNKSIQERISAMRSNFFSYYYGF